MSLSYEIDKRLKALAPVLDEHAAWHAGVVRFVFYPDVYDSNDCLTMPSSFMTWVNSERGGEYIESSVLDNLCNIHADLQRAALRVAEIAMSGEGGRPAIDIFDTMNALYDLFMIRLRQVEIDCVETNTGIDPLTGLRHRRAMDKDLANEMERRERQGRPFALALAQIDNFNALREKLSDDSFKKMLMDSSSLIKKCVRSFDDAYRSGEGEFIMLLKHSDLRGGSTAIDRLRGLLQEEPIGVRLVEGTLEQLTMSYCVAEPMLGESMAAMLENMRADLQKYDDTGGAALEYTEKSPLQRFVQGDNK